MNRSQIVPIPNSAQQPTEPEVEYIPLLALLKQDRPIFCESSGTLHREELGILIEQLFDSEERREGEKAVLLLEFLVRLDMVIQRNDPKEREELWLMFMEGKRKLFQLTMFFENALNAFESTCIADGELHWSEERGESRIERRVRLNSYNNRFELLPVKPASQEGGKAQ